MHTYVTHTYTQKRRGGGEKEEAEDQEEEESGRKKERLKDSPKSLRSADIAMAHYSMVSMAPNKPLHVLSFV